MYFWSTLQRLLKTESHFKISVMIRQFFKTNGFHGNFSNQHKNTKIKKELAFCTKNFRLSRKIIELLSKINQLNDHYTFCSRDWDNSEFILFIGTRLFGVFYFRGAHTCQTRTLSDPTQKFYLHQNRSLTISNTDLYLFVKWNVFAD